MMEAPQLVDDATAFLAAICERPDDDLPRLVFADWLDEHDEPERAEFIRVQCEIAGWGICPGAPHGPPGSPTTSGCECANRSALRKRERELLDTPQLMNQLLAARWPGITFHLPR